MVPVLVLVLVDLLLGPEPRVALWVGVVIACAIVGGLGFALVVALRLNAGWRWLPLGWAAFFVFVLPVLVATVMSWPTWSRIALGVSYVLGLVTVVVLRRRFRLSWPRAWMAVVVVIALPFALFVLRATDESRSQRLPPEKPIPTRLDVLIVDPRLRSFPSVGPATLPRALRTPPWNLHFSVGRLTAGLSGDHGVRLVVAGTPDRDEALIALVGRTFPPNLRRASPSLGSPAFQLPVNLDPKVWRPGAMHAVVINPDSIGPTAPFTLGPVSNATPADWQDVVQRVVPGGGRVFVLLAGGTESRLREWRDWAVKLGGNAELYNSVGGTSIVDAATRISITRTAALKNDALAWTFRPRLRFDTSEKYSEPLDVDSLFDSGRMMMCPRALKACEVLHRASELLPGFPYLKINMTIQSENDSDSEAPSAIYYHVVDDPHGDNRVKYIEYWWYFPYNPSPFGAGSRISCHPGFTIPGITCFAHESDWEGITVVVKRAAAIPTAKDRAAPRNIYEVIDVNYAEHDYSVAYSWPDLVAYWKRRQLVGQETPTQAVRPFVYVASGSHASYPFPCTKVCQQSGILSLPDGHHNGGRPWRLNDDNSCSACLAPLPTDSQGDPALWNAFGGRWGARRCLFRGYICDVGTGPKTPSDQDRYTKPWGYKKRGDRLIRTLTK